MVSKKKPKDYLNMQLQTLKRSKDSSQIYLKIASKILKWQSTYRVFDSPKRSTMSKHLGPMEQTLIL